MVFGLVHEPFENREGFSTTLNTTIWGPCQGLFWSILKFYFTSLMKSQKVCELAFLPFP